MIPPVPPDGKYPPPSLRAYRKIPWHSLDPVAKHLLVEGDKKAGIQHVLFIACDIARVYSYKRLAKEALESWCWSNKLLRMEVPRMVDIAYNQVYKANPEAQDKLRVLTNAGRAVYNALLDVQGEDMGEWFSVSRKDLAEMADLTVKTVGRQIPVLKEQGLIEMMSGRTEDFVKGIAVESNLYKVCP